jgi:AcrR family transcriptional regulator
MSQQTAGVDAIAAEAEVAPTTLYRRFASKMT